MVKRKILVVCGSTATGKTAVSFSLARRFDGELLSADSKQLYKDLSILTGKDIPPGFIYIQSDLTVDNHGVGYWEADTKLWGTDLLGLTEESNVSLFQRLASQVINNMTSRNKLPIIVGGTGLYIDAIMGMLPFIHIPKNIEKRKQLEKESIDVLQDQLALIDKNKLAIMNNSDRANPRRLIRAIEVGIWKKAHNEDHLEYQRDLGVDILCIGLHAPIAAIGERILQRIQERLDRGVVEEVRQIRPQFSKASASVRTILGLSFLVDYIDGKISKHTALEKWFKAERSYAKRQRVWFASKRNILWFDSTNPEALADMTAQVATWYTKTI